MFAIEQAISCLGILQYFFKEVKLNSIDHEKLTLNVTNQRAIEFVSKCFCIDHNDFKCDKNILKYILQIRSSALSVLAKIFYTPVILGELAY